MNTYYVQDENGEFPGKLAFQQNPPIEPTPFGFVAVTTVPDDERMYWDMVSAWYWPKSGLKELAKDKLTMLINASFTSGGNQMLSYNLPQYLGYMLTAMLEEPGDERFCRFDNTTSFPNMTNAALFETILSLPNTWQKHVDVCGQIFDLIDNETVVDAATLETHWNSLELSVLPRTRLPMLSDLAPFTQDAVPDDEAIVATPDNQRNGATDCYPLTSLTSVTFELPLEPRKGQVREFSTSLAIGSILFTNGTVRNPPTSLEANDNTTLRCTRVRVPEVDLEPAIPAEWIRV